MRAPALAAAILLSEAVCALPADASPSLHGQANPACPIKKIAFASDRNARPFVDCDATMSLDQFGHIKLRAATRLLRTYLGKWILARGKIIDVQPTAGRGKARTIEFDVDDAGVVSVDFAKSWERQVSGLKRGDWIAVDGQIQDANLLGVEGVPDLSLVNGQIVDPAARH